MSFVRNSWYVAGWSKDFDATLRPLEITGLRIVVYRASTGKLTALEDRCPHRLLPRPRASWSMTISNAAITA